MNTDDWELPTTRMARDESRATLWFGALSLVAWFCVVGALFWEAMVAVAFGAMFSVLAACSIAVVVVTLRRPAVGRFGVWHRPRADIPDPARRAHP